jgi:membrane protease subunit (stomatin/prohibitin family)
MFVLQLVKKSSFPRIEVQRKSINLQELRGVKTRRQLNRKSRFYFENSRPAADIRWRTRRPVRRAGNKLQKFEGDPPREWTL